ncbi:hypothetical protein QG37_03993 [Candidozyma auris]|uniref:Uncharacterized protein n=1 Tax=Candidozyma auris TaxID=498019 RepID=A0A0L0NYD1_CANAR|nr:hypothetical protein QG37_03993 [[Candida] auris]
MKRKKKKKKENNKINNWKSRINLTDFFWKHMGMSSQ